MRKIVRIGACLPANFDGNVDHAIGDHGPASAFLPITNMIAEGFNQKKPPLKTVLVALDLSKAYDLVDTSLLLEQISHTDLNPNVVRWLTAYLRSRSAAVVYQGITSRFRTIHVGVPQGSVLSPALFNFFVSDCPATSGLKVMFADGLSSALDLSTIEANLNSNVAIIAAWARRKGISISHEKLQVTFFSPNRKESNVHPRIY
jgi:hypothetical protein